MGYTFEKQTSDEERPMNCPHCTSPFAKEQRKKTILGYRTFRCASCAVSSWSRKVRSQPGSNVLPRHGSARDGKIAERIVEIYQQHQGRYGSPRIHQQLRDEGIRVGRKRVIRLMKQAQIADHHTTHRVLTTSADPAATPAENVLDRRFEAERRNRKVGRGCDLYCDGSRLDVPCCGHGLVFPAHCRLGHGGSAG